MFLVRLDILFLLACLLYCIYPSRLGEEVRLFFADFIQLISDSVGRIGAGRQRGIRGLS